MSEAWPVIDATPFSFHTGAAGRGGVMVCFESHPYPAIDVDVWGEQLMPDSDAAVLAFTVVGENGYHVRVMAQAAPSRHGHAGRWERYVEIVASPHSFDAEGEVLAHRDLLDDRRLARGLASVACFDDRIEECPCENCCAHRDEYGDGRAGLPLGMQVRRWVQRFIELPGDGWIASPDCR